MYGRGRGLAPPVSPRLIARLLDRLTLFGGGVRRPRFNRPRRYRPASPACRDRSSSLVAPTGSGIANHALPDHTRTWPRASTPTARSGPSTRTSDATVCAPSRTEIRDDSAPSGDSTGPDRSRPRPDGPPQGADRTPTHHPPGPEIGPVPVATEVRTARPRRRPRRTRRPSPVTGRPGQRGRRRCGACPGGDATRLR
jgi:hypothetical protein